MLRNETYDIERPTLVPRTCAQALPNVALRLLSDIAAWALSDTDVLEIFPSLSPARLKQVQVQINRDQVRVVMLVLSLEAMEGEAESFSIRKLARVLDRPREESMQRSLRNWLLPLLTEAGWIEGFALTEAWSTSPHEISITAKGRSAVSNYFRRVETQWSDL